MLSTAPRVNRGIARVQTGGGDDQGGRGWACTEFQQRTKRGGLRLQEGQSRRASPQPRSRAGTTVLTRIPASRPGGNSVGMSPFS